MGAEQRITEELDEIHDELSAGGRWTARALLLIIESLSRVERKVDRIVSEVEDLQAQATQAATDLDELKTRLDQLIGPMQAQIDALTAARDDLAAELGSDHAAVAQVTASLGTMSEAMDAFHADDPPIEG